MPKDFYIKSNECFGENVSKVTLKFRGCPVY